MSICNHVELENVLAHAVPVQTVSSVKASISVCSTDMNSGSAEPAGATAKTVIDSPDRAELVSTYVHLASLTFENKLMAICRAGDRMGILQGPAPMLPSGQTRTRFHDDWSLDDIVDLQCCCCILSIRSRSSILCQAGVCRANSNLHLHTAATDIC